MILSLYFLFKMLYYCFSRYCRWRDLNHMHWCCVLYFFLVEILLATTYARPRSDIAYCIHALSKRLTKTRNWIVIFFLSFLSLYNSTNILYIISLKMFFPKKEKVTFFNMIFIYRYMYIYHRENVNMHSSYLILRFML